MAGKSPRSLPRRRPRSRRGFILALFAMIAAVASNYIFSKPEPDGGQRRPNKPPVSAGQAHAPALKKSFSGRLAKLHDGDSLIAETARGEVELRLYGIDAPELKQQYGRQAKERLHQLARGEELVFDVEEVDDYGRLVVRARVRGSGLDLAEEMVRGGDAWVYEHYCRATVCEEWKRLERAAREARRGLWADPSPENPRQWRRKHSIDPAIK